MGRDRRPVRANSKATGGAPLRPIGADERKCGMCGRTLPAERMQPGNPPEWQACRECWAKSLDTSDKFRNPLSH